MAGPKAPISDAIATVALEVVAPSLKSRGYRKQRHNWHSDTPAVIKAITIQSSQFNLGSTGKFTLELGLSYPSLGEPMPDDRAAYGAVHHFRVSELLGMNDRWWEYADASNNGERDAVARDFEHVWNDNVLPFMDGSDDPRTVRDLVLARKHFLEAASMSRALNDPDTRDGALNTQLEKLRSNEWLPDLRYNPHSLIGLVHPLVETFENCP